MTEAELKAETRLMAIEFLLARLYVMIYRSSGITPDKAKEAHKEQLLKMRLEEFPSPDPALSDHASGVFEIELQRQLDGILEMLEAARSPK